MDKSTYSLNQKQRRDIHLMLQNKAKQTPARKLLNENIKTMEGHLLTAVDINPAQAHALQQTRADKLATLDMTVMNNLSQKLSAKHAKGYEYFYDNFDKQLKEQVNDAEGFAVKNYMYDNLQPSLSAWQFYRQLALPYLNEYLGGFIGDAIKERFFTGGYGRWGDLDDGTI